MIEIIGSIIILGVASVVCFFSIKYASKKEEEFKRSMMGEDSMHLFESMRELVEGNVRDTKRKERMIDYVDHDDLHGLMTGNDNVFRYMNRIHGTIALGYLLIAMSFLFSMLYVSINSIIQNGFSQTFIDYPPNAILAIAIIIASILFLSSSKSFFRIRRLDINMEAKFLKLVEG